jgi:hypothetical protein
LPNALFPLGRWLAAALLAVPGVAFGQDVYIEAKSHTDAVEMMGHSVPAQDGVSRTWIGDDRIAIHDESAGSSVIFRGDLNKMYVLFPKDRTYYESDLPFRFPPEVAQMMAVMKPEVAVTPTGESRVVNGFNTTLTKVNIKMMGQDIAMDYWVSKEVGVSTEQLRRFTQAMFAGNPMLGELGERMAAIDGYPVRVESRVSVMGSTFGSWQEVQKVEKKSAPPGTYEVPEGYTRTDRFQMGEA